MRERRRSRLQVEDGEEGLPLPSLLKVEELWQVSQYFAKGGHDNATDFFVASRDYGSAIEAMVEEVHVTRARATMIHVLGACYVWVKDKFRRTHDRRAPHNITAGDTFRLYLQPRVFPGCYVDDYADRIVYEDQALVILDKPEGCPCAPHLSNNLDCLDVVFSATMGYPPLIRMNRLDTCTAGLVALAKHKEAATHFQNLIRDGKITKIYRALVLGGPVPLGPVCHYMPPGIFHGRPAPRVISRVAHKGWKSCLCHILSCHSLSLPHLPPNTHEVEIELITGRTHQLRAQLSALGCPIYGDDMYIPMSGFLLDDLYDPRVDDLSDQCLDPKGRVALQCYRLDFNGKSIRTGTPWWRERESSTLPPPKMSIPVATSTGEGGLRGNSSVSPMGEKWAKLARLLRLPEEGYSDEKNDDLPWPAPPPQALSSSKRSNP